MANLLAFFLSALGVIGLDRLTKWLMTDYFQLPYTIGGGFSLDLIQVNSFIFSPIPDGLIFLFVAALVVLMIVWFGYRFGVWEEWAGNMGYGIIFGALGSNLFDRLYYGYILGWLNWQGVAVLNLADIFVVVGLIVLIVMIWRRR